jgi:hypothetical protein
MKNNTITAATWIENSLVDRPKDWDAVFTTVRGDGISPDTAAQQLYPCDVRGNTNLEPAAPVIPAVTGTGDNIARLAAVEAASTATAKAVTDLNANVLRRVDELEELVRKQAKQIKQMGKEPANVARFAPVRYPGALNQPGAVARTVVTGGDTFAPGDDPRLVAGRARLDEIVAQLSSKDNPPDSSRRIDLVSQMSAIKTEMAALGITE